ncbi:MAG TPA: DUF4440 domain-containing protein [Pyrinomonadaceae bacterium]|nr:DUF4440 domain-containing protein [Pyrinomonadaceae bacterium]
MKRIFAPAALLICAAVACTPVPTANNANTNAANANAANANTAATGAAWSESDITARERELWDALRAKNWDAFAASLADDQLYVGPGSVSDKAQTLEGVKPLNVTDVTTSDWRVVRLGDDAAVVTYTAAVKGDYAGQPIPADHTERDSTVWVRRGGRWLAAFHQETVAQKPPAASPSPAATTTASPAASPATAASPAAATTADAEANERMIWDLLKNKQWDAFAGHLAEDQIEVEPIGTWNKAESVRGVQAIDFSGVTLSNFRTVKLTDNATAVTYEVKGPAQIFGPRGSRHSTIWVNRGGRWQAAFHQGTWIEPPPPPTPAR